MIESFKFFRKKKYKSRERKEKKNIGLQREKGEVEGKKNKMSSL